jgi:hypothetical protein
MCINMYIMIIDKIYDESQKCTHYVSHIKITKMAHCNFKYRGARDQEFQHFIFGIKFCFIVFSRVCLSSHDMLR